MLVCAVFYEQNAVKQDVSRLGLGFFGTVAALEWV